MMTLEEIRNTIAPELEALARRIDSALGSGNQLMNSVVEGYLKSKGKMIRPILVILTAKMLGEVNDRVMAGAAAMELLHNASLIHDDVIDESKMRRGRPTVNSRWDNHIAVLVGDFFVSSSLQQALSTEDIRVVSSIASLGRLLSLGEIDQIYNARYHCLEESAYLEVIRRKTASLFVSCVEIGGYAVGASEEQLAPMRRYAELLGLCFQIRDDIFDYSDDAATIGKPVGNDLREGKVTLPLLSALNRTDLAEAASMRELVGKDELSDDEIAVLIDFARRGGGIDYAYARMEELASEGIAELERVASPSGRAAEALADIFRYIIERDR